MCRTLKNTLINMKALWAILAILACYSVSISAKKYRGSPKRIPLSAQNYGSDSPSQWQGYKKAFGKSYSSLNEEKFRQQVFQQNLKAINNWNELYRQGKVSYKVGVNKLADQTYEERKAFKVKVTRSSKASFKTNNLDLSKITEATQMQLTSNFTLDYTMCLSPVRDQKNCASGYAIAALTLMEYARCFSIQQNQTLSLDQALDCSTYSQGCKGGFCEEVLQYFTENSIMPESSYRPRNNRATKCNYDPSLGIGALNPAAVVKLDFIDVSWNYLQTFAGIYLWYFGPLAVSMDSGDNKSLFDFYQSGIYDDPNCANFVTNGNNSTNHAMVLVGVGVTDSGQKVWIAQNSMGTDWGQNGRVYLPIHQNTCNLELEVYAISRFVSFLKPV